ncbi:hypothetical protein [Oscillatoria sp. HE19RPO]|uniref:hypothetical protein n=1 Tax=Oscillatoria sp. HE19RPO TaxID=2954806 RepID=UPI0020C54043|nr:hypothetical protein [Oscillatoria sp. HE19RPO]
MLVPFDILRRYLTLIPVALLPFVAILPLTRTKLQLIYDRTYALPLNVEAIRESPLHLG